MKIISIRGTSCCNRLKLGEKKEKTKTGTTTTRSRVECNPNTTGNTIVKNYEQEIFFFKKKLAQKQQQHLNRN